MKLSLAMPYVQGMTQSTIGVGEGAHLLGLLCCCLCCCGGVGGLLLCILALHHLGGQLERYGRVLLDELCQGLCSSTSAQSAQISVTFQYSSLELEKVMTDFLEVVTHDSQLNVVYLVVSVLASQR